MCLPAKPGHTRLLYRMSTDFLGWTDGIPGMQRFWRHMAGQARAAAAAARAARCRGGREHGSVRLACQRPHTAAHLAPSLPSPNTQVLDEDLVLVLGQQDRLLRGGNTWRHPVSYDKLAVRYRRWRNSLVLNGTAAAAAQLAREGGTLAADEVGGGEPALTMRSGEIFELEVRREGLMWPRNWVGRPCSQVGRRASRLAPPRLCRLSCPTPLARIPAQNDEHCFVDLTGSGSS